MVALMYVDVFRSHHQDRWVIFDGKTYTYKDRVYITSGSLVVPKPSPCGCRHAHVRGIITSEQDAVTVPHPAICKPVAYDDAYGRPYYHRVDFLPHLVWVAYKGDLLLTDAVYVVLDTRCDYMSFDMGDVTTAHTPSDISHTHTHRVRTKIDTKA